MKRFEKEYRRPSSAMIMGWIYRRLGYETDVIFRLIAKESPLGEGGPPDFDGRVVLICTKFEYPEGCLYRLSEELDASDGNF